MSERRLSPDCLWRDPPPWPEGGLERPLASGGELLRRGDLVEASTSEFGRNPPRGLVVAVGRDVDLGMGPGYRIENGVDVLTAAGRRIKSAAFAWRRVGLVHHGVEADPATRRHPPRR